MFMQFNGDAFNQDLCTLADKFVKTDDTDFPLEDKAIYANMAEREVITWIFSVYGGWIFDSEANTDFPVATTALVNGQTNYSLPDLLTLKSVAFKLQNQDTWEKLEPITLEEINDMGYAEAEFERVAGIPRWYRPLGESIKIYPAANFDQDSSLETQFDRASIGFIPTSTTRQPSFNPLFHEAVAVFMALKYAAINVLDSTVTLQRDWDGNYEVTKIEGGFRARIKKWYSDRYAQLKPKVKGKRSDVVDQYV